jgi:glycosyltransferase involved in cell wall biosynthesis
MFPVYAETQFLPPRGDERTLYARSGNRHPTEFEMNVLVNAVSANTGGGVTYLLNLLRNLPAAGPEHLYDVYLPAATRERLASEVDGSRVRLHDYQHSDSGTGMRIRFDQLEVPRLVRKHGADVLFSTANYGTLRSPCPQLLLMQNTLPFVSGSWQEAQQGVVGRAAGYLRRMLTVASMRAADRVVFPTEAMRELVAPFVSLAEDRVDVIHYGFDAEEFLRKPDAALPVIEEISRLRAEGYHILLNVSHYVRHKNLETVVEALPHLLQQGHRIRFVTTVPRDEKDDRSPDFRRFLARIDELGLGEVVIRTGPLEYGQLSALYATADIFVFPSATESFGFPLVEAMVCGCPVAASAIPVTREICQGAGEYFPTLDAGACAALLQRLLERPGRRAEMSLEARHRARHFSWAKYAQHFVASLEQVALTGPDSQADPTGRQPLWRATGGR